MYRRYSDDLTFVIPTNNAEDVAIDYEKEIMKFIKKYKNYGLNVQPDKTEILKYENGRIYTLEGKKSTLDYLGLVMNGESCPTEREEFI